MIKKAQMEMDTFGKLTLILVMIILIISIWAIVKAAFFSHEDSGVERVVCRESVLRQAATRGTGGNWIQMLFKRKSIFDIDCPQYLITFYNDRVAIKSATGDEQKYPVLYQGGVVKDFKGLKDEMVNYVVSNEIRLCWYQFQEGKMDIFNKALGDVMDDEKVCFICDQITFDQTSFQENQEFKGLWDYIHSTENSRIKRTVYDYLADDDHICSALYQGQPTCFEGYAQGTQFIETTDDPGGDRIYFAPRQPMELNIDFSTSNRYSIFFVRQGLGKTEYSTYFSYVIQSDKLHEQCNQFIA